MMSKRVFACVLVATTIGCTTQRGGPGRSPSTATDESTARVSSLANAVARSRASLDATILELHRTSGETSPAVVARSRDLRRRAVSIDSAYRVNLAELLWTVNAATWEDVRGGARFPVTTGPVPLLRGFVDGTNWMVLSPMIHEIGKDSPYVVIVPRGFVTDLASIPQPLQLLRGRNPSTSRYSDAAVLHDYLYWRQDCTRTQADNIMAIAMMEAGVPFLERRLVHEAVRQFGQSSWEQNRKARESGLIRTVAPPNDQVPPTGSWAEYREWLRATGAKEGREYRVQESVCTMADSVRIPG